MDLPPQVPGHLPVHRAESQLCPDLLVRAPGVFVIVVAIRFSPLEKSLFTFGWFSRLADL